MIFLVSCGGGNTPAPTGPTTSLLTKRAFVSNEFSGSIQIVDASTDKLNARTISAGSSPQTLAVSGNKKFTMSFSAGGNVLLRIDNTTEAGVMTAALPGYTDSIAVSSDGTKAYAAVRNAPSSTGTPLGVVQFVDFGTTTSNAGVDVPLARRLLLSPNGGKLLVFSDDSDSVTVIDTATKAKTVISGFDRPAWGVFANDSTAYVMNCGPECGGTTAGVSRVDLTSNTVTTTVAASAATVGLLDGSTLYVAGTVAPGTGGGCLDVFTTPALSRTTTCAVINDGYHTTMAISSGRLFVGARACSNVVEGCLSSFSGGSATIGTAKGEVTGMQAISGRMIVYVAEGGELRVYNSSTGAEVQPAPINIVGKAWDVKSVD